MSPHNPPIAGPFQKYGFAFEDGLAPQIVAEAIDVSASELQSPLPILQAVGALFYDAVVQNKQQNTLHASDAQWGQWNAIFAASFIPTYIVYGLLCRKFPLKTLLWWGTVLAVPQMVPLLFINTVTQALIAAVPIGLMGGLATGAYLDLIIRSCPRGLQGTTLMMSSSLYFVVVRFGDVLGTNLYDRYGGFTVCVIAITIVYALILPALLLVPRHLITTADGQAPDAG